MIHHWQFDLGSELGSGKVVCASAECLWYPNCIRMITATYQEFTTVNLSTPKMGSENFEWWAINPVQYSKGPFH